MRSASFAVAPADAPVLALERDGPAQDGPAKEKEADPVRYLCNLK